MSSSADVDIVIVNFRCAGDTLAAVSLLAPWRFNLLWIVDNSDDAVEAATLRDATAHLPWVRLIVAERNLGFGSACNLAFARSATPLFLLLNPDARISPGDISILAQVLLKDPGMAGASPRIYWDSRRRFLLPVASTQSPSMMVATALAVHARPVARAAFRHYLAAMQERMAAETTFPVDFLAGAILMLRRQAVLSAGGLFDPDYFMFFEDSDLSLRLRRAGFGLCIAPRASAVHEYRHKDYKARLMMASRQTYFRKHFPVFFRLSRELDLVDRLGKPADWARWGTMLPSPIHTAADLDASLPNHGVVAFSPSPLLMPAAFRPAAAEPVPLDDDDWKLREPGRYMVAMRHRSGSAPLAFVSFERAAPA